MGYVVFRDEHRGKEMVQSLDSLKEAVDSVTMSGIQIAIDLTTRYTPNDVTLDTNSQCVRLTTGTEVLFEMDWKCSGQKIEWEEVKAKYVRKKHLLKITCPLQ